MYSNYNTFHVHNMDGLSILDNIVTLNIDLYYKSTFTLYYENNISAAIGQITGHPEPGDNDLVINDATTYNDTIHIKGNIFINNTLTIKGILIIYGYDSFILERNRGNIKIQGNGKIIKVWNVLLNNNSNKLTSEIIKKII